MGKSMTEYLIEGIRAAGMRLWIEGAQVKGKMLDGQRCSLKVRELLEQLRPVESETIAILLAEANQSTASEPLQAPAQAPEPYQSTDITLTGVSVAEALKVGEEIKAGNAELVGKVVYHKPTGLCDLTYRPLEVKDGFC